MGSYRYRHSHGGLLILVGLLMYLGVGRHVWVFYHLLRAGTILFGH